MHCSVCGEPIGSGDDRCRGCGGTLSRARGSLPRGIRRCPRCGYRGEGIPYFRRPAHVALLVGAGLFSWGLAGLAYWILRRNRMVCPNCGLAWHDSRPDLPPGERPSHRPPTGAEGGPPLPSGGGMRRAVGMSLMVLGVFLVFLGLSEGVVGGVLLGCGVGGAGIGAYWWGRRALQERRKALLHRLQSQILCLAAQKGGTLTVTEVATELGLSLLAAEKVLMSLDDGFRVRSEISSEGVLYYEFPEILHRGRLAPGESA